MGHLLAGRSAEVQLLNTLAVADELLAALEGTAQPWVGHICRADHSDITVDKGVERTRSITQQVRAALFKQCFQAPQASLCAP